VQALAFRLDVADCVQISMNLTDVAATSVPAAFERVARLAESRGLRVASSEIVGLAPRRALRGATASGLLLADRLEPHVLEDRVEAACP
jgi:glutamate formiminotransferase